MLTVNYQTLKLRSGQQLLDLGCGFGRHTYEAAQLGAQVVACDLAFAELTQVRATYLAVKEATETPELNRDVKNQPPGNVLTEHRLGSCDLARSDATCLPFASCSFDKIIASEVLEHLENDETALCELHRVLRPGGTLAVTVPSWFSEKICWALSDEYHAPKAAGGHVRIYRRKQLQQQLQKVGLLPYATHRAHALHSPYWWLRCAVGLTRTDQYLVTAYRKFLEWDIVAKPTVTRVVEQLLNPVLGKSLVIYCHKPAGNA